MRNKSAKILGIVLVVTVLGTVMTSCKASHDVCPAYTKVEQSADQY